MSEMLYRTLGSTGETVSVIGLGGYHLALKHVDAKLADGIMRGSIDGGINFFDNSWDYNEGESEIRMGRTLKGGLRKKVFLMTKIDGRSKKEATRQLDESLRRLQTDSIDLVQHHEVIRFEDPHRIFDKDGANAALMEARQAGKIRYIGFTGHKDPRIHLHMLEVAREHAFRFDTAQMPLNVMDAHYRSFGGMVVPELVREGIGVLGMKSMGDGFILKSKTVSARECLRYALSLPTSVVITGIDTMEILGQALEVATDFRSLDSTEMQSLLAKTRDAALAGEFEPFKVSSVFDATSTHPAWLGQDAQRFVDSMT